MKKFIIFALIALCLMVLSTKFLSNDNMDFADLFSKEGFDKLKSSVASLNKVELNDKYQTVTATPESGRVYTVKIEKLNFTDSGDIEIELKNSATPFVEATVSEDLIKHGFKIDINGAEIKISSDYSYKYEAKRFKLVIAAEFDEVEVLSTGLDLDINAENASKLNVELNGTGDVDVYNLSAQQVELNCSGAMDVQLTGEAELVTLTLWGTGNIEAEDLLANEFKSKLYGKGNVISNVVDLLEVEINGFGTMEYYGSPQLVQSIRGIGSVKQISTENNVQ